MNGYAMWVYAQTRLEQSHEDAASRRLLRASRAGKEQPSTWRRWLRRDRRDATGRRARLAEAS